MHYSELPEKALAFLRENAIRSNYCSHCKRDDGFKKIEIGRTGMFLIYKYELKDGGEAVEFVQSSGPMLFGLKVSNGRIFEWTIQEINEACGNEQIVEEDEV